MWLFLPEVPIIEQFPLAFAASQIFLHASYFLPFFSVSWLAVDLVTQSPQFCVSWTKFVQLAKLAQIFDHNQIFVHIL